MIATSLKSFPAGYRIISIEVVVPMAVVAASHLLWPFALNPWFLSFSVSDNSRLQCLPLTSHSSDCCGVCLSEILIVEMYAADATLDLSCPLKVPHLITRYCITVIICRALSSYFILYILSSTSSVV